jgi:hypothetical protein
MKTFLINKMKVSLVMAIAVTSVLTACNKSHNDSAVAAQPVYNQNCQNTGCTGIGPGGGGIAGGQIMYSASTQPGLMEQANFSVSALSYSSGSINGTFMFNTQYICQSSYGYINFQPGQPLQFASQTPGQILAGNAFYGPVVMNGPQGAIQGMVQVVPVSSGHGVFTIQIQGCQSQMDLQF